MLRTLKFWRLIIVMVKYQGYFQKSFGLAYYTLFAIIKVRLIIIIWIISILIISLMTFHLQTGEVLVDG